MVDLLALGFHGEILLQRLEELLGSHPVQVFHHAVVVDDAKLARRERNGQEIAVFLVAGTITTSDAGAGVGYTTLRVRGTDGTRINVTANGIPINDAESHTVFWVNLPDFASSVKDMQVQRGAGTSTNGAGAFGASINMQTGDFSMKPYAEFNGSYGSFHTHKETVKVGTGLINNHWSFDARLSNISTDGYIDRASVGLNSYYLQGGYYNDNTSIKLITFAGKDLPKGRGFAGFPQTFSFTVKSSPFGRAVAAQAVTERVSPLTKTAPPPFSRQRGC